MPRCLLLTQSGHERFRIAAVQIWALSPISSIANPCCNQVLIGVVPALGKAMRRRDFIKVVAGSASVWPLAAHAQQPVIPVIGFLGGADPIGLAPQIEALRLGLRAMGILRAKILLSNIAGLRADMIGRQQWLPI